MPHVDNQQYVLFSSITFNPLTTAERHEKDESYKVLLRRIVAVTIIILHLDKYPPNPTL